MTNDIALYAARFVHFGAAMLLFGAALFPFYTGEDAQKPRSLLLWIAFVSALLWAACVVVNIGGGVQSLLDIAILQTIFFATNFGAFWLVHLALSGALLIAAPNAAQRSALFCSLAGLNLASLAGLGHAAMESGVLGVVHPINHAIHLLAGGAWLGGLAPLRRVIRTCDIQTAHIIVQRFSRMGYTAAALVLVTGFANLYWLTGSVLPNTRSPYGELLAIKLICVTLLIALAAANRVKSNRPGDTVWLRRAIIAEYVLFSIVLIAISVAGVTAPH